MAMGADYSFELICIDTCAPQLIAHNKPGFQVELVSKELNPLAAILHVYAGGLNFMK